MLCKGGLTSPFVFLHPFACFFAFFTFFVVVVPSRPFVVKMGPKSARERHRSDRSDRSDDTDGSAAAAAQAAAAAAAGPSTLTAITSVLPPLGPRAAATDVAPEDVVQAVLLADSFNQRFMPMTVPQPKVPCEDVFRGALRHWQARVRRECPSWPNLGPSVAPMNWALLAPIRRGRSRHP